SPTLSRASWPTSGTQVWLLALDSKQVRSHLVIRKPRFDLPSASALRPGDAAVDPDQRIDLAVIDDMLNLANDQRMLGDVDALGYTADKTRECIVQQRDAAFALDPGAGFKPPQPLLLATKDTDEI